MRAGEGCDDRDLARARRGAPAPTIRALGVLAVLAAALVLITGGFDGTPSDVRAAGRRGPRVEVLGEQVTRPEAPPVPSSSTTTTTSPPPPVLVVAPASAPVVRRAVATTCADTLAYLAAHQAPGFTDSSADGGALGHLGWTCVNQAGMCEGRRFIRIACPAPFVYMNEAHNSWVLLGVRTGIDPYGQGSAAERAACAAHR